MGSEIGQEIGQRLISVRRVLATLGAALAAVALIFLTLQVSASNKQRDEALMAQRRSFEVMILARNLESAITRSEAELGRYVVNQNRKTGYAYFEQWRRARTLMDRLEKVTSDDARQRPLIGDLRRLFEKRGVQLSDAAIRTNYRQGTAGISYFYKFSRDDALQQLSATLESIIATERMSLEERIDAASASVERSNDLATILSLAAMLMVGGAGLLGFAVVQASAQRRLARQAADQVARRAEELEQAVATRTAELQHANAALKSEAADREAAQAQLRQIQKMEAVGQLTGGIAHDFNNMLAVVIGGLELAKRRLNDERADAGRHLDNAMEGASRAAALTRRLLAFARAEPLLPEAVSPDTLIAGMADLLDRTLGERIEVRTDYDSEDWAVWVDRHQLENALLNLAVNARDAMEGEGVLTIKTLARTIGTGEYGEVPAGDYAVIAVTDTGCGMDKPTLERVFEPFFTTKPVGKGTGLGLSQIFGFVRQSSGEIAIESEPGHGTTVSLLLPRYTGDARRAAPELQGATWDLVTAGERERASILVVEDDARVLNATVEALMELGHIPIPCPMPDEAMGLLAAHPEVRLILSDVVMPGTTGPELIASLRPLHPNVGVLFVTGYAGDVDEASAFGGHDVLRKPFTIGALARSVDAALNRVSEPNPYATAEAAE